MPKFRWKLMTETIGLISIVMGLFLVAWEIRQANHIARAEAVMGLAEQWNQFNSSLIEDPEVAQLYRYVRNPGSEEVTDTDLARLEGMAWHFINIFWAAHIAHENGLLGDTDIRTYRADLEWMVKYMPGLNEEWVRIYETSPYLQGVYVLEPIADLQKSKTQSEIGREVAE